MYRKVAFLINSLKLCLFYPQENFILLLKPYNPLTTAALLFERHARLVKSEIIPQKAQSIHAPAHPPEIQSYYSKPYFEVSLPNGFIQQYLPP